MNHAEEILEERQCFIRALLRKLDDDHLMTEVLIAPSRVDELTRQLAEVNEGLAELREASVRRAVESL